MSDLSPKTMALMAEMAPGAGCSRVTVRPKLDGLYRAHDLPAGSVVHEVNRPDHEYVVGRTGLLMRWEQPIPGTGSRAVVYAGRLAGGEWLTPRQRAQVDEVNHDPKVKR